MVLIIFRINFLLDRLYYFSWWILEILNFWNQLYLLFKMRELRQIFACDYQFQITLVLIRVIIQREEFHETFVYISWLQNLRDYHHDHIIVGVVWVFFILLVFQNMFDEEVARLHRTNVNSSFNLRHKIEIHNHYSIYLIWYVELCFNQSLFYAFWIVIHMFLKYCLQWILMLAAIFILY